MNIFEFTGKFHPLVIHLPIGILVVFLIIAFIIPRKKLNESYQVIRLMLLISALGATFSCLTGWLLAGSGSYSVKLLMGHRILGFLMAILNWGLLLNLKKLLESETWIYYITLISTMIVIVFTGHMGGTLTHGTGYLDFPKSGEWFGSSKKAGSQNFMNSSVSAEVFQIFEAKCVSCHGENKQKGGLRMDSREGFEQGGNSGSLLADSGGESLLIHRITLPLEHEDHMPPEGRSQLESNEIELLSWWIENGAPFDAAPDELELPESLKGVFQSGESDSGDHLIPKEEVEAADASVLQDLRSLDVLISPVAMNSNYLSVSFINVIQENRQAAFDQLIKMTSQIIWLNLDYQELELSQWEKVSLFSNLRKLSAKNSNLTDQSLVLLKALDSLSFLNVVGTDISGAGLEKIVPSGQLESIYLFDTPISESEAVALSNKYPGIRLELGNYIVPILESDTTVLSSK